MKKKKQIHKDFSSYFLLQVLWFQNTSYYADRMVLLVSIHTQWVN